MADHSNPNPNRNPNPNPNPRLLVADPAQRMGMAELLEHPWVKPSADKCRVEIERRMQAAPPAAAKPKNAVVGGAATESDTDGGESEDGGQPSTPGGTPSERRMRAASLHTIATVGALEAEGKRVEAAEVLAAQLEHLKAICDGETGGRPELDSYGGDDGRRAAIDYGGDGGHPGVAALGLGEKQNSLPGEGVVNSVRAMFSPRFAQSMDAKLRASSGADSSRRSGS